MSFRCLVVYRNHATIIDGYYGLQFNQIPYSRIYHNFATPTSLHMHDFWYGKIGCRAYFLATAASSRSALLRLTVVSTYEIYHHFNNFSKFVIDGSQGIAKSFDRTCFMQVLCHASAKSWTVLAICSHQHVPPLLETDRLSISHMAVSPSPVPGNLCQRYTLTESPMTTLYMRPFWSPQTIEFTAHVSSSQSTA